jgi:hypothetical protein
MDAASGVTLRRVACIAAWLARIRPLFLVVAVVNAVWLMLEIGWLQASGARSLLAVSGLLWSGIALGIGYMLPVPPMAVAGGDGIRIRLRKRLVQVAYLIALAVTLGLVVLASILTVRALGIGVEPGPGAGASAPIEASAWS